MSSRRTSLVLLSLSTLALLGDPSDAAATVGKQTAASAGKRVGKPLARVLPAGARARPLTLAQPAKAQAPAPFVRAALTELAARSEDAPRLRLDPTRGTLRRFDGRVPNPHGAGRAAAERLLAEHRDALGLAAADGAVELVARRVIEDEGRVDLVYDLRFRGLPVWGAELAAHFDQDGALTALNAQGLGRLDPPLELRYGPEAARARARRHNAPEGAGGVATDLGAAELGVWPQGQDLGGRLAWRLVQSVRAADGAPQHWRTYVDAQSGAVLARRPLVHTEVVTKATGEAENHAGEAVTLRLSHYQDKGVYGLFDQSKGLAAATLQTLDGNNSEYTAALATSKNKDAWSVALASAHDHMQRVVDYYQATHARNSWDGKGALVRQVVHYGLKYNNAHWDAYNQLMAIGDGDSFVFKEFSRALDVAAHEYSHAVITATADLVYQNQPGALNESFADVMAVMVDRDDWTIGEDVVGAYFEEGFARSFIDPPAGAQPKHMDFYYKGLDDFGGVHINSGIPNHAAYQLATSRSRELVERVWYRTLYKGHVGSQASFIDMAEGTVAACQELASLGEASAADCTATAQAWVAVGVLAADAVPQEGCPEDATEKDGLCYCDPGHVPSGDGSACVPLGDVDCPANAIEANGLCLCQDGYKPTPDGSQCVALEQGCPLNSSWDAQAKKCVCDPGFEGAPNAQDGKCEPVDSDCPTNSHPEWPDPAQQADYLCVCNENFQDDGQGGCEVVPGTCGNESFHGRCDGDTLIYCQLGAQEDEIVAIDCAGDGLACGRFDSIVGYDCLNPEGKGPAETCEADGYQECGAGNPFCVSEEGAQTGFCSHECKAKSDCQATAAEKAAYDCCASVSDGTRACLVDPYCAENIDTKATCKDVPGGSSYYGKCVGDVLVYCDGSTGVTQEVYCAKLGLECGFVDAKSGYSCVEPDSGALPEAPTGWCPYEKDGLCDAPELCPEGSDGFDCNPCGEVPENGVCEGDTLKLCDPEEGLVVTDCAQTEATPSCGAASSGAGSACIPGQGPGDSEGDPTEGSADSGTSPDSATAGGDDGATITCSCRQDAPQGWTVTLGALGLLALRRRRPRG